MRHLYESILDDEDDVLDDDGIIGLKAAKGFMKNWFPGDPGLAGYLVYNILLYVLTEYNDGNNGYKDPVTDEEYEDFANDFNGEGEGAREFLKFLKFIYMKNEDTWRAFGVGGMGDCELDPEIAGKVLKSNGTNLKKLLNCVTYEEENIVKNIIKGSTEFVISDNTDEMEEFYVFTKPKSIKTPAEKEFLQDLFKYIA